MQMIGALRWAETDERKLAAACYAACPTEPLEVWVDVVCGALLLWATAAVRGSAAPLTALPDEATLAAELPADRALLFATLARLPLTATKRRLTKVQAANLLVAIAVIQAHMLPVLAASLRINLAQTVEAEVING